MQYQTIFYIIKTVQCCPKDDISLSLQISTRLDCVCVVPEIEAEFTVKLSDTTAEESETVQLSCEVSKPDVMVDWLLNKEVLAPSEKFDMTQDGVTHTLTSADVTPDDSGTYTARVGGNETSASLTVKGKFRSVPFHSRWYLCARKSPPPPPPRPSLRSFPTVTFEMEG